MTTQYATQFYGSKCYSRDVTCAHCPTKIRERVEAGFLLIFMEGPARRVYCPACSRRIDALANGAWAAGDAPEAVWTDDEMNACFLAAEDDLARSDWMPS